VHRIVMADLLGIPVESLPATLHVHHIDENPLNNSPENLALVTAPGHRAIHDRYLNAPERITLRGLSLDKVVERIMSDDQK